MNERFYGKIDLNEEIHQNLTLLKELELNLELCITDSSYLYEKYQPFARTLAHTISELNLRTIFHLPFYGLQLGCKDTYIRKLSYEIIIQGLKRCSELNMKRAVMHVATPSYIPAIGLEKWLQSFYQNLEKILGYCEEKDITLLLENTFEPDPEIFATIFQRFPSDKLSICLDIAHIYCYSEANFLDWWSSLSQKIQHIHLSDNNGEEDSHLALGEGIIDFQEVFEHSFTLPVTYTLETEKSCFRKSIHYLKSLITPQEKIS
ncbi:MAG: sugar phosphate isomerase/epimerase [Candidatus Cloacimonetes bacterium]|nr:sugar phosphate isomerase/epimerase [Candidatus Cloacimonadota bacterium]